MVALSNIVNRKLCKIIAVRTGEHLFEMSQTGHHGDNVVLDIAEVKSNVHVRRDFVIGITSLSETLQHICFATQKFHEAHHILANHADLTQECVHVIVPGNKDLIFYDIGFLLDAMDDRCETIHNIVTRKCQYGTRAYGKVTNINA